MSAATSAATQVRRPGAPTRTASPVVTRPAMQQAAVAFAHADNDDDFRLNLSDIPRMQESMEVEGMRPHQHSPSHRARANCRVIATDHVTKSEDFMENSD